MPDFDQVARVACLAHSPSENNKFAQTTKRSFLRHPGLAQPGDVGGFEQCADLGCECPEIFNGPQADEARIAVVGAQPAGLGDFGAGMFGIAGKGVGGSEASADVRMCRGALRAFSSQTTASSVRDCTK